jgi:hypothetical protein
MEDGHTPRAQTFLDPMLVERMKALVESRTRESLNERFGISYNTWRKLIAGAPVRSSLAARLQQRLQQIERDSR